MGLQAHGAGSCAHRRQVLRRVAALAPDRSARARARVEHAELSVAREGGNQTKQAFRRACERCAGSAIPTAKKKSPRRPTRSEARPSSMRSSPTCRGSAFAMPALRHDAGIAMSPAWGHVIGVIIVLLMLIFIGIWVWAWLPFHKKTFEALARIPLNDDRSASARGRTAMSGFWSGWVIFLLVAQPGPRAVSVRVGSARKDPCRTRRHERACLGARCAA